VRYREKHRQDIRSRNHIKHSKTYPKQRKPLASYTITLDRVMCTKGVSFLGGCSHDREMSGQAINVDSFGRRQSLLEHGLRLLRFIFVFHSPSMHIPALYLKTAHDRFPPNPLNDLTNFPTARHYINYCVVIRNDTEWIHLYYYETLLLLLPGPTQLQLDDNYNYNYII
jgi:hypothetical protein